MPKGSPEFETTLWSQIILASREPSSTEGREALEELCRNYWYPVYAFVRRRGTSPTDAEDLTQGFFAKVLANGFLGRANPSLGRFRNFLLNALNNYIADEYKRLRTQRRGGAGPSLSFDFELAESHLAADPSLASDPIRAFDRLWATTMIERSLHQLEKEQAAAGRSVHFAALKEFLQRSAVPGEYEAIANRLGMTKGAVSVAVHRLGGRLAELVRKNVRDTVVKPEMADEEMKFLFSSLAS